jgi:hypothetical protein
MSNYRQLKRHTTALLSDLGNDPDEIADSLHQAGVKGVPQSNQNCAVALYLSALMGADPRVRSVGVGRCAVRIDTAAPPGFTPTGWMFVQLPKPVRGFVAAFDDCKYPDVIRQAVVETGSSNLNSSVVSESHALPLSF